MCIYIHIKDLKFNSKSYFESAPNQNYFTQIKISDEKGKSSHLNQTILDIYKLVSREKQREDTFHGFKYKAKIMNFGVRERLKKKIQGFD